MRRYCRVAAFAAAWLVSVAALAADAGTTGRAPQQKKPPVAAQKKGAAAAKPAAAKSAAKPAAKSAAKPAAKSGAGRTTSRPRPAPLEPFPAHSALHCAQNEAGGYSERADVALTGRRVDALAWTATAGRHGQCRFDLADFTQRGGQDQVALDARDGSGCQLLIWRRGRRVTLAHQGCDQRCGEELSERIWPVSFDARGGCAR